MTTQFIGTTFPSSSDWHADEKTLIGNIYNQIESHFSTNSNLFINTTWFGPQFDNNEWVKYKNAVASSKFDNLFLLAAADPVFLNHAQIADMQQETGAQLYCLGHFDSPYYFNFHSQVLPKYFVKYDQSELLMRQPKYVFVNYNRKPRDHRSALVNLFLQQKLDTRGVITLGQQHQVFGRKINIKKNLSLNETPDTAVGNWGMSMEFGIPHDIHSLGNLEVWQNHFLTVVGETEFFPWDNLFISEKTWKPILGLRPFVINGQTKVYNFLRNHGFRTFEHYFNGIKIENISELEVHDSIVKVVEYFAAMNDAKLMSIYQDMLPDLLHNQNRFWEFSAEQKNKINQLFV